MNQQSSSSPINTAVIGKGRGRQVIAVARTADLVLMMLDASKGEIQKSVKLYMLPEYSQDDTVSSN